MIETIIPSIPSWGASIVDSLLVIITFLASLRVTVTGKLIGMSGKLDNHIVKDDMFHSEMLRKLEENTVETKKNSDRIKPFTDNEIFFKELINIGSLGSIDIKKFIRQQYIKEVITEKEEIKIEKENDKVDLYINRTMDSLSHFCRDLMTVGIEDIDEKLIYSKASTAVQIATKLFSNLWGKDYSVTYVRLGRQDRERLIKGILALPDDVANNKDERFKILALYYAHEMIACFSRFYYTNKLSEYIEVER